MVHVEVTAFKAVCISCDGLCYGNDDDARGRNVKDLFNIGKLVARCATAFCPRKEKPGIRIEPEIPLFLKRFGFSNCSVL